MVRTNIINMVATISTKEMDRLLDVVLGDVGTVDADEFFMTHTASDLFKLFDYACTKLGTQTPFVVVKFMPRGEVESVPNNPYDFYYALESAWHRNYIADDFVETVLALRKY